MTVVQTLEKDAAQSHREGKILRRAQQLLAPCSLPKRTQRHQLIAVRHEQHAAVKRLGHHVEQIG